MSLRRRIFTLGYVGLSPKEFISICEQRKITKVVDIRRFPVSAYEPFYNKETLESFLAPLKIGYTWLGEDLGGFRQGGYEPYTKTKAFLNALELLESKVNQDRALLLCSEADWTRCHRKYIAESLEKRGWRIMHLGLRKEVAPPEEAMITTQADAEGPIETVSSPV